MMPFRAFPRQKKPNLSRPISTYLDPNIFSKTKPNKGKQRLGHIGTAVPNRTCRTKAQRRRESKIKNPRSPSDTIRQPVNLVKPPVKPESRLSQTCSQTRKLGQSNLVK